jgi:uncharacterized protein with PIN domain
VNYTLSISCPHCGKPLEHVASGRVYAGTECSAIARCTGCRRQWQVHVALRPVETPAGQRKADERQRARERVGA